jgi:hypothetical protein
MRESTIEQKESIFIVRLYEKVLVKVINASSKHEAEFISRCWDSGIFSKDEFDATGL